MTENPLNKSFIRAQVSSFEEEIEDTRNQQMNADP